MKDITISDSIIYVGVDDKTIDLFESQYVVPNGVSYNSYIILDDKITIMDTVDKRGTDEWLANVKNVLGDNKPYYLVVSHLEPDHAGNVQTLIEMYPDMKIVGNAKTFAMIGQFFDIEITDDKKVVVNEGDTLELGKHTLQFFMAPMYIGLKLWLHMNKAKKFCFPQTDSVNLARLTQMKTGHVKQGVII